MLPDTEVVRQRPKVSAIGAGSRLWLKRYRYVCAVFLVVILLGLPSLVVTFSTDNSDFALGARTILSGGVLYRDFWEVKPPAIYFVYALAFLPFGQHMVSLRILDLVNTALAMGAIYLLGRRFFGERAGIVGGCLYGVAYLTRAGFDGLGEVESFVVLPVVLSVLLYRPDAESGANGRAFASGLLMGLAFSLKLSAVFYVAALPAMEVLFAHKPNRIGQVVRRLSLAFAGFLVIPVIFTVHLAAGGALRDFIDIQRLHVWPYTSLRWAPSGESFVHFGVSATQNYLGDNLFLVVPAVGAMLIAFLAGRRKEVAVLTVLAVASLVTIWSQGKFFDYHWLAMIFPLALLAGYSVDRLIAFVGGRRQAQILAVWALAGAFLWLLTPSLLANPYHQYHEFLSYAVGRTLQADNESYWNPLLPYNRQVVDYVKTNGGDDKSVFVWGNWPVIYWWTGWPLVNRFIFDTPFTAVWSPEIWRTELVDDLQAKTPHFLVIAHGGVQPWMNGTNQTPEERIQDFPAFRQFIVQNYQPAFGNTLFSVFKRKGT